MTAVARDEGMLDGLRVLDFSIWRPGPYATQLLAELGADVLKVEPPGGDPMRAYPDLFESVNAGKRGLVLDLKDGGDRRRALELGKDADVVVEGWRPGVADRLGVGHDAVAAVNQSVVYCSVSGMGQTGPLSQAPGHDAGYLAWAGALSPDGAQPAVPRIPVADLAGGMAAAFAICAALVRRGRTGEGEYIDLAMADVLATWTGAAEPRASGAEAGVRGVPGYGVFETADGHVTLSVLTEDHFWRPLCEALGLGDVADLTFEQRMGRVGELQGALAATIAPRSRDELVGELLAAGVPAAPVLDRAGMLSLPHFVERGVVTAAPGGGLATSHPIGFTARRHGPGRPAPGLDEHRGEGWA